MQSFAIIIFCFGSLVSSRPNPQGPSSPAQCSVDANNPAGCDPTSPPTTISNPTGRPPDPYPSGIPVQPDTCDGQNPSSDCFNAMSESGGYIWFDENSECSDDQKNAIGTAVWDAVTLAGYSSSFPNDGQANRGQVSGHYYIGPDFASQQDRISGNFQRTRDFKTARTSDSAYITASCKDTQNVCKKNSQGKVPGGYGWTYNGWFAYYHYITLCDPFFTTDSLDMAFGRTERDLASGSTRMATDMAWMRTTGSMFLHEMMHTRIADGGKEPHITDEYVDPIPDGELPGANDKQAYGPELVHQLAQRKIANGGGATRASTNADSYALLANAIWWWDTTGYFPGVVGKNNPSAAQDDAGDDDTPVMLYVDLGNNTNPTTVDFNSLFNAHLAAFGNGEPDPNDMDGASITVPPPSPPPPPPPPPSAVAPPSAYATGICSFHLTETEDCDPDTQNLFAIINLKDGQGNDIGDTTVDKITDPIGDSINVGSSYSFTSKLPNPLVVTGEHQHDYIQFTYGALGWASKTPNGGAHCNNGGWDPRDGPICDPLSGTQNAVNNMDCFFPC